jgi:hypothetical protein
MEKELKMKRFWVLTVLLVSLAFVPTAVSQEEEEMDSETRALQELKSLVTRVKKIEEQNQEIIQVQQKILGELQTLRFMVRRA